MLVEERKSTDNNPSFSIIIPTYNESQNIIKILKRIEEIIPKNIFAQTIVVDDNSPDGTAKLVEDYIENVKKLANNTVKLVTRTAKSGLSSAIIKGIQEAKGETIVVMDSDMSHPPQIIPKMIEAFKKYQCDIVVASRYVKDGKIENWTLKRKIISKTATKIAKDFLNVEIKDPMSGFFAFRQNILDGLKFDGIGYKILLELLVKSKNTYVKEIPYTFTDRQEGSSKLDLTTMTDYLKSVWNLYRFGQSQKTEKRKSIKFFSKIGRFFTVGASGLGINYLFSLLFSSGISDLWFIHANLIGIIASMTSNFFLNKSWTFEDNDYSIRKTLKQYTKFVGFSSLGAAIQLGLVYYMVNDGLLDYPIALIFAVSIAAIGNFMLNKKLTFKEKIWS